MGVLKQWWRNVRPTLLSDVLYFVVRSIGITLRIRSENYEAVKALPSGCVIAGWHGRSMVAANFFRGQGVWAIISQSKDGDAQNRIFKRFGFKTIRGSTGRGGVRAAIEAIKVLRDGAWMALTPDGPRGPEGVVQPGVMLMAQKSGAALVPIGIAANPRWLAPTWDHYMLPYPFAKALMLFGEPMFVPGDATPVEVEQLRLKLEADIHRLHDEAEGKVGVRRR